MNRQFTPEHRKFRRLSMWLALPTVFFTSSAHAAPSEVGEWGPLIHGFPVPAVHSLLLHTNKVLFFRGDGEDEGGVGDYRTHILNLDTFEFETTFQMDANIFCSGHSYLPDGRILLSGGEKEEDLGPVYVHTFDPITETWNREPDMRDGRYYPTNTALGDGTTLFFAGRDPNGGRNPAVERFIPAGGPNGENIIEYLQGSDRAMTWYPRMHLLPDGKVFRAGQEADAYTFDPHRGTWQFVSRSNYGERYWGTSVALPPGQKRIMIFGGQDRGFTSLATNTAEIIDFAEPNPQWRFTSSMNFPRMHVNVVLLPDGKVFVAGGTEDAAETIPVFESEMYDPQTEQWTILSPQESVRTYHSTSLLLPDARVMWLGAYTDTGGNTDNTAQIYSPAYLFQGYRPTLSAAPDSADYGQTFTVATPDAATITSVVMIRPSATTHSVNMAQRYVPLDFTQTDANTLQVTAPTNPNEAPPGYYMLFLVDGSGVPAVAPFIRLGGALPPNVYAGETQDVILPANANLNGTVTIFGDPASTTVSWSAVSGPAGVIFGNPNAEDTTATFSAVGTYIFRLTAESAGFSPVSDTVEINVLPEGRVQVQVSGSTDDAEEAAANNMKLTSLDLEMLDYDAGAAHQAVGLRFNNITVANGTQIANAYVQFTAATSSTVASTFTITGEAIDNASTFSSAQADITSRTPTSASVSWSPRGWTAGLAGESEATANIAPVIQEIVGRPGWISGNSLVLMITGGGNRVADSFDLNPAAAPILHVDPAESQGCQDGIDNDLDGAVDYPDDPGCSSASDPSEREASRICDDGLDNDGDGLIDYPSDPGCVSLIDGSESEFEALCIDGLDNDGDGLVDYPDDPGCASGDDNDERGSEIACDDGADNDGDLLSDFPDDPGCESSFDTSEVDGLVAATFTLQTGNDDSEQKEDGSITLTSSDLEMLNYDVGGPHMAVGVRFENLDIPKGATIQAASVQFTAVASASGTTALVIHGENSDSASPFSTAAFDLTSRPATAATVNWSPGPWASGASGTNERTADLASIIQEIVDRPGWSPGGAVALIFTGSGDRTADTLDASSADAAVLAVEYLPAMGGNTTPVVSISSPANGTSVVASTSVSFAGSAADAEEGNLSAGLSWVSSLDGEIGRGVSFSSSTLSVGTHTITASVTDGGGLTGSAQVSVTVTNTAPAIEILSPLGGESFPEGVLVSFSATANDSEDGSLSGGIVWSSNKDGVFGTGASVSAALSKGRHKVTATIADSGGLSAAAEVSIRISKN